MSLFKKSVDLPVSADVAFRWHERSGAFSRLNPPWRPVTLTERHNGISDGNSVSIKLPLLPFRWTLRHQGYVKGSKFEDLQTNGPFSYWHHIHSFIAQPLGSKLVDSIRFSLPVSLGNFLVELQLCRLFRFRHSITKHDLSVHQADEKNKKLHIIVTGANGMIGEQLCAFLLGGGHTVTTLGRTAAPNTSRHIVWDFKDVASVDLSSLEPVDAVINLSGANIAGGRWTKARKKELFDSRVVATRNLCEVLVRDSALPEVFIGASGTGFYGDMGEGTVGESAHVGRGFLSELAQQWETASNLLQQHAVRVVHARFGVVISARGGAMKKMLLPFKFGLGAILGNGKQGMSWIAVDDLLTALLFLTREKQIVGACNVCSPETVTNKQFSETLGIAVKRPVIFSLPAFLIRIVFGQMGEETLLFSQRALPEKLQQFGFRFKFSQLLEAFRLTLGEL